MKKIMLILFVSSLCVSIYSDDEREKDYEPGGHWKDMIEYTKSDIEDLENWKKDVTFGDILDEQIELKKKKIVIAEQVLKSKKKNSEDAENQINLIDYELGILYLTAERAEQLKRSEEDEDSVGDAAEILRIYDNLIKIRKDIFKLKKLEYEERSKLTKIYKIRRLKELQEELDRLKEEM